MLAPVRFLKELELYQHQQPFELYGFPTPSSPPISNLEWEYLNIPVNDARGHEGDFTLDGAGFLMLKHTTRCLLSAEHFESAVQSNEVVQEYLEETMGLLKSQTGASRCITIDWRFRRNDPEKLDVKPLRSRARPIGGTMHCDYSYAGGYDRISMHLLPSELEAIKQGQMGVKIVNVWRPLRKVDNAPLFLCDRRTIHKRDLVESDKVLANKVEKGAYMVYRDYHEWHYLSGQDSDEVLIFVTWMPESDPLSTQADIPAHGASREHVGNLQPRESVEVRMIILSPIKLD